MVGAKPPWLRQLAFDHVDRLSEMRRRTLPTVVDRRLLTELLIDACVGEQVRSRAPAELLAAWVHEAPRWGDEVRRLVQEALPSLHGDEGRLGARRARARLRELVEADELPKCAWGPLWAAAREPLAMDRRIMRRGRRAAGRGDAGGARRGRDDSTTRPCKRHRYLTGCDEPCRLPDCGKH